MPVGAAIAGGATSAVLGSALGGGKKKKGSQPREFKLSNPLFEAQLDRTRGPDFMQLGAKGALADLQSQGITDASAFNALAANNPTADFAGQSGLGLMQQAQGFGVSGPFQGNGLFNPASAFSMGQFSGADPFQYTGFSPMDVAQQQFNLLNPLLQEDFSRDRLNQESRQFAQGRLGSTPGSNDVNALLDAQYGATRGLLGDSFGLGLAAQNQAFGQGLSSQAQNYNQGLQEYMTNLQSGLQQNQNTFNQGLQTFGTNFDVGLKTQQQRLAEQAGLFNTGMGLAQFDPALRGLFSNVGTNALNNTLNIQNTAANTFNALAAAQGRTSAPSMGMGEMIGAGLLNSGANQIASGLGGLFQPPASTYTPQSQSPFLPGFQGNPHY